MEKRRTYKALILSSLLVVLAPMTSLLSTAQEHEQTSISYRNAELKRLSKAVGINTNQLQKGDNRAKAINGENITIDLDRSGMISHIGRRLFPAEVKPLVGELIANFLERYSLALQYPPSEKTVEQMMRDDHFKFITGNARTFSTLQANDVFSCSNENGIIHANWQRNGKDILAVQFPAEFELLSGENKIEAEKLLEQDLLATDYKNSDATDNDALWKDSLTADAAHGDFYILRGNQYLSEQLNSNRYYQKDATDAFQLVRSATFPAESCVNMMLDPLTDGDYQLRINQNIYGFDSKEFCVPLRQWLSYCRAQKCQLYCAYKRIEDDNVYALVVAANSDANYNHTLSVQIPIQAIDEGQGIIDAELYAFVPTHNIKNLFGKSYKNKALNPKTYIK